MMPSCIESSSLLCPTWLKTCWYLLFSMVAIHLLWQCTVGDKAGSSQISCFNFCMVGGVSCGFSSDSCMANRNISNPVTFDEKGCCKAALDRVSARYLVGPGLYLLLNWHRWSCISIRCRQVDALFSGFCMMLSNGLWSVWTSMSCLPYKNWSNLWKQLHMARHSFSDMLLEVNTTDWSLLPLFGCNRAPTTPLSLASTCKTTGFCVIAHEGWRWSFFILWSASLWSLDHWNSSLVSAWTLKNMQ